MTNSRILLAALLLLSWDSSILRCVQGFASFQWKQSTRQIARTWANANDGDEHPISFQALQDKRVLVVGGSGRVGGSVVTQLIKRGATVTVGGTSEETFQISKARWQKMFDFSIGEVTFAALDREDSATVTKVLSKTAYDLVVHTAGPFQGKVKTPNGVIDACVSSKVPYIDVCDDYCTASAAKAKFAKGAVDASVPCIISTGCWVRTVLCKQLFGLSSNKLL